MKKIDENSKSTYEKAYEFMDSLREDARQNYVESGFLESQAEIKHYYEIAVDSIKKNKLAIEPEAVNYGAFIVRKCKCGALFVEEEFSGFCGKCGQRIEWKK